MARKVLLITADQWRGDLLGPLGHPHAVTPNLDRLAARGVTFTRHYTPAAPCGPARATLLTGLYPFVHRSVRNGTPLDARHGNIALEMRKAGYEPVLFGYTDSSADPRAMAPGDPRLTTYEGFLPGFRVEASLNGAALSGWATELARKGYPVERPDRSIYRHPGSPPVMERFSNGAALFRAEDSDTAYIADKLIDFLHFRRDEDWFAHVVFLRPHPPIIAPAPWNGLVDPAGVALPRRAGSRAEAAAVHPFLAAWMEQMDDPAYFESQVSVTGLGEQELRELKAVYFGLAAEVDHHIGRILDLLEARGELEETLVVFTSDHGEMLGDHHCWGKGGFYEASNHVPLIIADPATPQSARGRRVDAFTESVDLVPTILDRLRLPVPHELNGLSLLPWLDGETPPAWRDYVVWEFDFRGGVNGWFETRLGLTPDQCTLDVIRTERYKYVHFTAQPPLLFDLAEDLHEERDIAGEPEALPVIAALARRLLSHRMLHAERSLANVTLGPRGATRYEGPRGLI